MMMDENSHKSDRPRLDPSPPISICVPHIPKCLVTEERMNNKSVQGLHQNLYWTVRWTKHWFLDKVASLPFLPSQDQYFTMILQAINEETEAYVSSLHWSNYLYVKDKFVVHVRQQNTNRIFMWENMLWKTCYGLINRNQSSPHTNTKKGEKTF